MMQYVYRLILATKEFFQLVLWQEVAIIDKK